MFRYLDIVLILYYFLDMPFRYIDDIKAFDCQHIVCHIIKFSPYIVMQCGYLPDLSVQFHFTYCIIACYVMQLVCKWRVYFDVWVRKTKVSLQLL
jgi:hypothetical protein